MVADDKTTPVKRNPGKQPAERSAPSEIDAFLKETRSLGGAGAGRGRLIFALDATMSRQPTWDTACSLQAQMFEEAGKVGSLDVQLLYYRGFNECRASKWVGNTTALRDLMTGIQVRGGHTQIGKVLSHARRENGKRKVGALVFVGDAIEEPIDTLAARAGELGLLGVKAFVFQEGRDSTVESGFREIARLTGGAYARFDTNAAGQLADLLRAAAVYAAGGMKALETSSGRSGQLLLEQMRSR
ncbi:VWA domain-containing protein [Bauldia litoralis]|uniref:VWA domain-containing protein n=1 Tax=Bauldia litoralis TaxID=665467 RepID=UPI003263517F